MLNQTFSYKNFNTIFDLENRKGNLKPFLPRDYKLCTKYTGKLRRELHTIYNVKKSKRRDSQNASAERLKKRIKEFYARRDKARDEFIYKLVEEANQDDFYVDLEKKEDVYVIKKSAVNFFVMKQLQYNLQRLYGVRQASRHTILSQIKPLLKTTYKKIVIRTDIKNFYESISHEILWGILDQNSLLTTRSKRIIHSILSSYSILSGTTSVGLPRGVGISAFLAELYMNKVDELISKLDNVVYYARYVDDIILVYSRAENEDDSNVLLEHVSKIMSGTRALDVHQVNETTKTTVIDFSKDESGHFTYLGYKVIASRFGSVTYQLSGHRMQVFRSRIDRLINYYNKQSKYDLSYATKVLLTGMKYLSSNYKLSGTKSYVRAGLYYSNVFLDDIQGFKDITCYYKHCVQTYLLPYKSAFRCCDENNQKDELLTEAAYDKYCNKLKERLLKIDFKDQFHKREIVKIKADMQNLLKRIFDGKEED